MQAMPACIAAFPGSDDSLSMPQSEFDEQNGLFDPPSELEQLLNMALVSVGDEQPEIHAQEVGFTWRALFLSVEVCSRADPMAAGRMLC